MATQAANLPQMSGRDLQAKLDAIDVDYTTALDKSELVRLISRPHNLYVMRAIRISEFFLENKKGTAVREA